MEDNQLQQSKAVEQVYSYAATLLVQGKNSYEVTEALMEQGYDRETAASVIEHLEIQIVEAKRKQANKDMLYGALWCVGGLVATLANVGFIFWGAIVFGGIQFFKGMMASIKN